MLAGIAAFLFFILRLLIIAVADLTGIQISLTMRALSKTHIAPPHIPNRRRISRTDRAINAPVLGLPVNVLITFAKYFFSTF